MNRIAVGYDAREALAYHTFCQSVIKCATKPVGFYPLAENLFADVDTQRDGSNAFLISRFLVPSLMGFEGWALFCDGDMVVTRDIGEVFDMAEDRYAVQIVQHSYKTKNPLKYLGSSMECPNIDYPRKNWSSVILWNCAHPANALLTPGYVSEATSTALHRFEWLRGDEIGPIPADWNYLVGESPPGSANLYHHTLGVPGIKRYADDHGAWHWHHALLDLLECAGESPEPMIRRSLQRVGGRE